MELSVDPFNKKIVDAIIGHFDDHEEPAGLHWRELVYMEEHGYDWTLVGPQIHIQLEQDPIIIDFADFTEDHERTLLLQMRQAARCELGLKPLTQEEESNWIYKWPLHDTYKNVSGERFVNDMAKVPQEVISAVLQNIEERRPDVVRYISLVKTHNSTIASNSKKLNESQLISGWWVNGVIGQELYKIIGLEGPYAVARAINKIKNELFDRSIQI